MWRANLSPVFPKSPSTIQNFPRFRYPGRGIKAAPRDIHVAPVQIEKNPGSRRAASDNTVVQSGFGDRRHRRFLCVGCDRGSAFRISQRLIRCQRKRRIASMSERNSRWRSGLNGMLNG